MPVDFPHAGSREHEGRRNDTAIGELVLVDDGSPAGDTSHRGKSMSPTPILVNRRGQFLTIADADGRASPFVEAQRSAGGLVVPERA